MKNGFCNFVITCGEIYNKYQSQQCVVLNDYHRYLYFKTETIHMGVSIL